MPRFLTVPWPVMQEMILRDLRYDQAVRAIRDREALNRKNPRPYVPISVRSRG